MEQPFARLNTTLDVATATIDGTYMIARVVTDTTPDPSYLYQEGFGGRLRAYRRGEFHFVGVTVTAFDEQDNPTKRQSLWGIESDSDPGYFGEVARELAREVL